MPDTEYFLYELHHKGEVVYISITDNPLRRMMKDMEDGKSFSSLNVVKAAMTQKAAEFWLQKRLERYRSYHEGKNPRYN